MIIYQYTNNPRDVGVISEHEAADRSLPDTFIVNYRTPQDEQSMRPKIITPPRKSFNNTLRQTLVVTFLILCLTACKEKRFSNKSMTINGITLKGKISEDTVLDGEIEYYKNDELIAIRNFKNGKEDGEFINYYANGKVKQRGNAKDGLTEGEVSIFNISGDLFRKEFFFKGRLMGPQIEYDSNKVKSYSFISFEGNVLCRLSYFNDYTIIDEGNPFYNVFSKQSVNDSDNVKLFCYNFHPPRFRCQYSIGKILGNSVKTFSEVEKINSSDLFFERSLPAIKDSTFHYCVKAEIYDSSSLHSRLYYGVY